MARTPSAMIPLGTKAAEFLLPDTVSGKKLSFQDIKGPKGTVVYFICNHCPFVVHVVEELSAIGKEYQEIGIGFVAISANDIENYPDDAPDKMKVFAEKNEFTFPYLYDESQDVAKAYDAACTPDIYVFDENDQCVYRGQLDDSRPESGIPVTGKDLREALNCVVDGVPVPEDQKPSLGCNIKWKK